MGRADEGLPSRDGLLLPQAGAGSGGEEKEEVVDVTGEAKTSAEAAETEEEQETPEAVAVDGDAAAAPVTIDTAACARRVLMARPSAAAENLEYPTMVDPESEETERWCTWRTTVGERQEDLGICDNSPTKPPGVLLAG